MGQRSIQDGTVIPGVGTVQASLNCNFDLARVSIRYSISSAVFGPDLRIKQKSKQARTLISRNNTSV
jgi:hypothetical protein